LVNFPLCPFTVTVTVTAPALPAGVVAVIVALFTTTTLVAAVPPNVTVAPATKFVPVTVTAVPPPVDPAFGLTLLTVGAVGAALTVNVSDPVPVPLASVALSVTIDVPAMVGVPEINPVALFTDSPVGKPEAP
jgi:hypothetical protein